MVSDVRLMEIHPPEPLVSEPSPFEVETAIEKFKSIVTDLIKALPGNSSVNMNTDNNRKETLFSMQSAPSESMEVCCQATELKDERCYSSVLSSEFSVEDSHGKFVVEEE
jgi:hypothetical protein